MRGGGARAPGGFNFQPAGSDDEDEDFTDEEGSDEDDGEDQRDAHVREYLQMDSNVRVTVTAAKDVDDEWAELDLEFQRKRHALAVEYNKQFLELHAKRKALVTGAVAPAADAAAKEATMSQSFAEDSGGEVNAKGESDVKGVSGFWLRALNNAGADNFDISEWDLEPLQHLIDVRIVHTPLASEDADTFLYKVEAEFSENDFFSDSVLTTTFEVPLMQDAGTPSVVDRKFSGIAWKSPEKNVTVERTSKTQRKKGSNATRTVTKEEPRESFFNFFLPADTEDEEEAEYVNENFFRVAEHFTQVVPQAANYFIGIAMPIEEEGPGGVGMEELMGMMGGMGGLGQMMGGGGAPGGAPARGGGGGGPADAPECKQS